MFSTIFFIFLLLIMLLITVDSVGSKRIRREVKREAATLFAEALKRSAPEALVAELERLPVPVQRYLRMAGVPGRPVLRTVRLKQKGAIRLGPGKRWLPLEAKSFHTTDPDAFLWYADITAGPFVSFKGVDRLRNGKGRMQGKVFSLIPLFNATGAGIDEGSWLRYLGEAAFYPSRLLHPELEWTTLGERAARLAFPFSGKKLEMSLFFNASDELIRIEARRPRSVKGGFQEDPWIGEYDTYKEVQGYRLPFHCRVSWELPAGRYTYYEADITDVAINEAFRWW